MLYARAQMGCVTRQARVNIVGGLGADGKGGLSGV